MPTSSLFIANFDHLFSLFLLPLSLPPLHLVSVKHVLFVIVLILLLYFVPSLHNRDDTDDWALQEGAEKLLGTLAYFADDAAFLAEEHALLHSAFDVDCEIDSKLAVELGDPAVDFDTAVVWNLLEELFHDGLL